LATIASRIAETCVIVTNTAGDDTFFVGPFEPGSAGSAGKFVISVASMDPDITPAYPFAITFTQPDGTSNTTTAAYLPPHFAPGEDVFDVSGTPWPTEVKDFPIFPASLNTTDGQQACNPLPDDTPDLTNMVALVLVNEAADISVCSQSDQFNNLAAKGARFIFLYSDPSAVFSGVDIATFPNITIALIENTAAVNIVQAIAAGQKVTVDFSQDFPGLVGAFNPTGGVPSGPTSYNALYDLTLKPDIAAPGGSIFSTWYLGNNYAILSGTAMATPYVAGVAALYVSATGGRKVYGADFAKNFMSKVISSGESLPYSSIGLIFPEFDASVDQIGTGLIQADRILTYNTTLAFEKFSLNDTNHFSPQHSVNITNNGDAAVTYTFSLQPAGGYEALREPNGGIFFFDELLPLNITPSVRFPSGNFVIQAGQTKVAE
jgi:subtilisin family serine protease